MMSTPRRSRQNKKSSKKFIWVFSVIIIIGLVIGLSITMSGFFDDEAGNENADDLVESDSDSLDQQDDENIDEEEQLEEEEPEPEPVETFTDIRIAAVGDIMVHSTQLTSAYDNESGTYNFKPVFEDVKQILNAADLTIANLETTTAGPSREYTGYPIFNSPDELIDAIKYAGVDVLSTANNHSLDTGRDGLKRTVSVIREKGLDSVGTYDENSDGRVLIKDVDGIKIAILSYTESTNGLGAQYAKEDLDSMLNMMEEEKIMSDIREAKSLGADLIITYMHWGQEYMPEPNEKQVQLAHRMAEEGADVILGSHPHVIQKSEFIETNGRQTFVIYSMGNFVSNQRIETLGSEYENTEDGVIVNLDIRKSDLTGETTIQNVEYVPTWVLRHMEQGKSKYTYRILPIEIFLLSEEISEEFKKRMERSYDATITKMDETPIEEN